MSEHVASGVKDGVRRIALTRPEVKNALAPETVEALRRAFADAAADPETCCVILTGEGGAFCAGADLRAALSLGPDPEPHVRAIHELTRAVFDAPMPVVAMVDGAAVGFGANLAFACDLRICSTRAYFAQLFVRIGLTVDGGGTWLLPRLVGLERAFELTTLGERVEAADAQRLGLCSRVVEAERLEETTQALARRLADGPALALRKTKRNLHRNLAVDLSTALDHEIEDQLECLRSPDLAEGLAAFFEKRPPKFGGRRP